VSLVAVLVVVNRLPNNLPEILVRQTTAYLAQYALTYSRSWAADSTNQRVRLKAENDHLTQEVAQLREEVRIKDVRMAQIDAKWRPHYPPTERMAILELRATRGWSLEQTAKVFLVTAETISFWVRRIDEAAAKILVQVPCPSTSSRTVSAASCSG
jgi:predicted RNA polymerase sigma factor